MCSNSVGFTDCQCAVEFIVNIYLPWYVWIYMLYILKYHWKLLLPLLLLLRSLLCATMPRALIFPRNVLHCFQLSSLTTFQLFIPFPSTLPFSHTHSLFSFYFTLYPLILNTLLFTLSSHLSFHMYKATCISLSLSLFHWNPQAHTKSTFKIYYFTLKFIHA